MAPDLVVLGAPGCGKGTQAAILTAKYGILHIATGEIFRAQSGDATPTGMEVKAFLERGELVPDRLAIAVIRGRLTEPDAQHGFVLDGFPRTVLQARALDAMLWELERPLDAVLYLRVDRTSLVERLQHRAVFEQRADDRPEVADHRIDVYLQQTAPLVDYYRDEGKLSLINGSQPPEAVALEIEQVIRALPIGAV